MKKNRTFTSEILQAAAHDATKFQPQHTPELNHELMEKWSKFGLLKGLKDDHQRGVVAQILENESQWMINEADTADAEGYNTTIFPMVRRVFGGLLANDIVSVQPMSLPSGLCFYIDFVDDQGHRVMDELLYNNGYGMGSDYWLGYYGMGASNTHEFALDVDAEYAWYTGSPSNPEVMGQDTTPYAVTADGFSDDPVTNLHKYSLPEVYICPATPSNDPTKWVRFYVVTGTPEASNQVKLELNGGDTLGLEFFDGAGGSGDLSDLLDVVNNNTKLYTLDGTETCDDSIDWTTGTTGQLDIRVNFGHNPFEVGANMNQPLNESYLLPGEDTSNIKELNLEVKSSPIIAKTRKLKTKWTPELQQDLQAYHSIDAEQELTSVMSDEVAMEIDREIIRDLIGSAGTEIEVDISAAISAGETAHDRYRVAVEAVMAGSNAIHKKTLRGYGNWIIVSPEFATVLQFAGAFLRNDTDKTINFSGGMQLAGLLENRVKVYVDPYMPASTAIMGYTGSSFLESGYVYSPYVPVMITPTVYDPNTFVPRKGLMTRYGKKLIRSDFFCRINITGWPTAGLGSAIYSGGFGYAERAFNIGRGAAWNPTKLN